jgi:DNA-binding Lrp family transcriptional regulator
MSNNQNSKLAHQNIKPRLALMYNKIIEAMERLRKDKPHLYQYATFATIAREAKLNEAQVWKRLSEMEKRHMLKRSDKTASYQGEDGRTYKRAIWQLPDQLRLL